MLVLMFGMMKNGFFALADNDDNISGSKEEHGWTNKTIFRLVNEQND